MILRSNATRTQLVNVFHLAVHDTPIHLLLCCESIPSHHNDCTEHEAELIRLRVRHSAEFDELNTRIRNVLGNKQRAIENLRSELSTALSRVRDLDGILSNGDDDDDLDARFLRGNDSSFDSSRGMKRYAK